MAAELTLTESERRDYEVFTRCVMRKSGIDLRLYNAPQMHRRLQALVERASRRSFADYWRLLESDQQEYARFLDHMTINVSELFRNPPKWQELETGFLPGLLAGHKGLRAWSAGCSYGAEPYSLAMLLLSAAPGRRHYLLATDIDAGILARARRGVFAESDMRSVPPALKERYILRNGAEYEVARQVRDTVTFKQHNLLADAFESGFDLILCRNVVIYFTEEAKSELFRRFAAALRPGGVLFVGGTERVNNHRDLGLECHTPFFYVRAGR